MRQVSTLFGLTLGFLLFSAAIAANISGHAMPEMRGAWVAQALR